MENVTINSDLLELDNIFDKLDFLLSEYDYNLKLVMQLKLAVEEIFTNICNYAYDDKDGMVVLSLETNPSPLSITIKFEDHGSYFNPLDIRNPDTNLTAEEREIGGLGIFLVKKNVDEIQYENIDGKNVLTIKKHLI